MIRVGVGKKCLLIDRINDEPREYIVLKNKKEIEELLKGLAELIYYYSAEE